ncbi:hypothetical protein BHC57_11970 [Snodgrassella alvi]|uniref:Uncharacterized protein n=1 Tax=Snodgrassella alvi TaxID=1196083 RepID=A0A855FKE5_9NEIS|nr:hypothetical protein BHC51_11865 [Snodgrassella alvi]PIT58554.1 hypothetical protein BHC57_11970 [Snodgrassella alvi]
MVKVAFGLSFSRWLLLLYVNINIIHCLFYLPMLKVRADFAKKQRNRLNCVASWINWLVSGI